MHRNPYFSGCGASVPDVAFMWGDQHCEEWAIRNGQCELCTRPLWCNDSSNFGFRGSVNSPEAWWKLFGTSDGGNFRGSRQCKYMRSQVPQFIDVMRYRANIYKRDGVDFEAPELWNEVSLSPHPHPSSPRLR